MEHEQFINALASAYASGWQDGYGIGLESQADQLEGIEELQGQGLPTEQTDREQED